jgi:iron complex outermembrane recepter protein
VINFRTRRDINAPQISIEKNSYAGSVGAIKLDVLTGWAGDTSNLLISASHSYEAPLLQSERDFSNLPFAIDPAMWTLTGSNPGQFQPSSSNFHTNTAAIAAAYPGIQDRRSAADCTDIGGQIANVMQPGSLALTTPAVPNTSCAYPQAPFQSLVNESRQTRAYSEFNADITDTMEFSFSVSYSQSTTLQQRTPVDPAAGTAVAIDRSTDAAARRGFTTNNCFNCNYVVPVQIQNFSPTGTALGTFVRNPFIDDFITRTGTTSAVLPDTGALYMGAHWRPFSFGGNPLTGNGRRQNKFDRESIIVDAKVAGTFGDQTLAGLLTGGAKYEFSGNFNEYVYTVNEPDIFTSRLQNALLGYGGPNCNAVDRLPTDYTSAASYNRTVGIQSETSAGTNGCQWFNPFASGFPTSVINGAANPQFNAGAPALAAGSTARPTGYVNPVTLVDWMMGNRIAEFENQAGTFNALVSNQIPESFFSLPGGEIGWALGAQWRVVEGEASTRDDIEAEEYMNTQLCPWPDRAVVNGNTSQQEPTPGAIGCPVGSSAFYGAGRAIVSGAVPPYYYDTQTIALFTELQFPVLDNFNVSLNLRHEEYNGGDLIGDIYSIAGKYNITDNLYIRASNGSNYRADGALELSPGATFFNAVTQARFGPGIQINQATIVAPNIGPEDDRTTNIGIGWESELFEGRIRASVDFFEILIDGQVATTGAGTIYNNVFGANTAPCQTDRSAAACATVAGGEAVTGLPAAVAGGVQFANCNSRLVSFVVFSAPCQQGVTTSQNIDEVDLYQVNGPGFVTNGVDYKIDFAYPIFDGTFSAQLQATQNMVYKARGYGVNGILFDSGGKRLGRANYTSTGNESRRWRGNATFRWANDAHNISLRANYSSGVYNEAYDQGVIGPAIIVDNPATTANEAVFSTYGYLPKSYLDFDLNYIWTAPFWKDFEVRATLLNIFDKAPSAAQSRTGYYPATGNPRGRQFEIGLTKKF